MNASLNKKSFSEYSLLFASEAFKVKKYKFLFLVELKKYLGKTLYYHIKNAS
jgi:hypothetical protein